MPRKYTRRRRPRNSVRAIVKREIQKNNKKVLEVKHKAISYGMSPSTTPYGYNMLEYIGIGDDAQSRDGNRINMLSENLRINVEGETPYTTLRMMIVETREPMEYDALFGLYNCSEMLANPPLGINSNLDYDTCKRTFLDKTFLLRELVNGVNPVKYIKRYLRHGKTGKKIFYDGNTTGLNSGNCRSHYYLVFMTDSNVLPHPRVTASHNIRFTG